MSEDTEKRSAGRPSEYDPAYCGMVIGLGKEGKGRAEIASALDCSRQTLANWEGQFPEFLDAMTRAGDESLAWWENKARGGIEKGSGFNAQLWGKCMNGRFPREPYRERVQVTGANDGPVQTFDLSKVSDADLARLETILHGAAVAETGAGGADKTGD